VDHHQIASEFYKDWTKDDDKKLKSDPLFYQQQSRMHLLYLTVYTSELIGIAKGIQWRLTIIAAILILCVLGILSVGRF
jgi:hypothetical protein